MRIADNCVAKFHYTLTNNEGEILDSSEGKSPLTYLHGAGNIVPGLEKAMVDKAVGDKFKVEVDPEEGYGIKDPGMVQEVPMSMFSGVDSVEVGMSFQAQTHHGDRVVEVVKIEGDIVTIDGNHPLAGVPLNFDIEVTDVREATSDELEQGHI